MEYMIVTNNPLVHLRKNSLPWPVAYDDKTLIEILVCVRDLIHLGHHLYSHPLSGSVKPNETIYKSIIVSEKIIDFDYKSLQIIEQSILLCKSFPTNAINYSESICSDFQMIDLTLLKSAL